MADVATASARRENQLSLSPYCGLLQGSEFQALDRQCRVWPAISELELHSLLEARYLENYQLNSNTICSAFGENNRKLFK